MLAICRNSLNPKIQSMRIAATLTISQSLIIMHWWQLPFSSPSKSQSADDAVFYPSRRVRGKSTTNDVVEWRPQSNSQHSRSRSSPALPQPLPLPEFQLREPKIASAFSHNVPLPSPGAGRSHRGGCGEEREMGRGRRAGEGHGLEEHFKRLVGENTRTSVEQSEIRLSRNSSVKQCAEETSYRCNTIIPKSDPTSPVSSPQHSDTLTTYYMSPPGVFHAWSTLEMPHSNVHTLPLPPGADMSSLPTPGSSNSSTPDHSGATMTFPPTPISTLVARPELPGVKQASPNSQVPGKPEPIPTNSQWQKGKLIGKGTFGSVYVASNRETGALCAMKEVEILPEDLKSQESMRQLEQEINVLSNLKHPNIVQYYGSEIVGDKFYIYLEYVHPGSINKFIHDHCAAITESIVRNFTRHILCGLAYLHSTKTIHRDIKGANLLVDAYGVVKLADFGMAKHLSGDAANLSLKGSPYWLAPELLQPILDASADLASAVDIWSLGCTIIEMINGKPPWSDCEGAAAMFKVLKESPPIPETLSPDGKDFLQCCFRRNPTDRPTAVKLLDHPFVSCTQSVKEMQFRRGKPCHKIN